MPYIGFILCTIYTYVIWMKVLWTKLCVFFRKKRNRFCVKRPCFLWLQSNFCLEFCLSLSEETEFFSLSLGCFFCYLYFLDVLWNSYQLLLILLIGDGVWFGDSIFHFFPVYLSLSWKRKSGFLVIVLVGGPFKGELSEDINISFEFKLIFCFYSFVSFA